MKTIGIDIGTTSICAVLYDTKEEKVLETLTAENTFLQGSYRQDPMRITKLAKELLDQLLDRENKAERIGISTQMHGILYVDKNGKAVSDFYTWKETSGNERFRGETYASYLAKSTGYPMYTGYGSVTHFVLQQRDEIPAEAIGFVSIGDYLAMELCGLQQAKVDPTVAASFGGFQLDKKTFDRESLKRAGENTDFYPRVIQAKEIAGYYRRIPVMWAVGDNQASFYAAVGKAADAVGINVGTGSQVSLFSNRLFLPKVGEVRPFGADGYLYVQASLNGGKVYERLASFFEEAVQAFTGVKINAYEGMRRLGELCQETALRINPALYGMRGEQTAFGYAENLTADNFHPADFIRAYVAGMAEELYQLYCSFPEELKEGRRRLAASGNGIRKNVLLKEELEKRFGLPVQFCGLQEEAAAGAAMLAAAYRL